MSKKLLLSTILSSALLASATANAAIREFSFDGGILDDNYPGLLTTTILACLSIYIISFFCSPFLFNCITYNI